MVSVVMAVYNGEKYIREQIDSILVQLREKDELIISYNESIDGTLNVISEYEKNDDRIQVFCCSERGVIPNFENAIKHANGDVIFLCDQDDIWDINKISKVMKEFNNNVVLVEHNCEFVASNGAHLNGDLFKRRKARKGYFKNLCINCYQGSCMAFKKDLVKYICPIPRDLAMHDQWIGLIAEKCGNITFLDEQLIKYRRHDEAVSDINVGIITKIKTIIRTMLLLNKRYGTINSKG